MINLNGTVKRKFFFPADPPTTLAYFADLSRIVYLLPHINVVEPYSGNQVRIRYQTVELGAYTINIFCDLHSRVDPQSMTITVAPMSDVEEVASEATLNSTTGYGYYRSSARLYPEGDGTGIDYYFQFESRLQRPRGLRMMPKRVVDRIAQSISMGRVEEIVDGFMQEALELFPNWLSQQDSSSTKDWLGAEVRLPSGRTELHSLPTGPNGEVRSP